MIPLKTNSILAPGNPTPHPSILFLFFFYQTPSVPPHCCEWARIKINMQNILWFCVHVNKTQGAHVTCVCACVRVCYRACLVLSDPGEIGALASASIVLCILKGHWGVGGVEMRLPLVPSGPDFTPWSTSASPLQIWPDCHLGWHRKGAGQHPGRFGLGWRWRSTAAETSAHGLGQVWASIPGYPGRPSMVSCSLFHWISWWALLCHTVMVLVQTWQSHQSWVLNRIMSSNQSSGRACKGHLPAQISAVSEWSFPASGASTWHIPHVYTRRISSLFTNVCERRPESVDDHSERREDEHLLSAMN